MAGFHPASLPHLSLVLGPDDKTLTAAQGTYSVTGQDAAFVAGSRWGPAPLPPLMSLLGGFNSYTLSADYGTYSVSGKDAGSLRGYVVAANFGEYLLAGQAGILDLSGARGGDAGPLPHIGLMLAPSTVARVLTCDTGLYFVFGSDALADFEVTAAQGTYTVTGQDATLLKTTIMQAEYGTYSVSGQDVVFEIGGTDRVMPADQGTYTITGFDANLVPAYKLSAEQGFYALLGQAASLVYSPPATYTLTAESGTYSTTGYDAVLDPRRLYAEYGTYEITGYTVIDTPGRLKPAGRSKSKRRRTVEIDGRRYEVASEADVEALFAEVRRSAEEQAQTVIDRAQKAEKRPLGKVLKDARKALVTPEITAEEDLRDFATRMKAEIEELYKKTLQTVEIGALMRGVEDEDEDDDILMLL